MKAGQEALQAGNSNVLRNTLLHRNCTDQRSLRYLICMHISLVPEIPALPIKLGGGGGSSGKPGSCRMSRAAMSWVDGPHLCKIFVKNSALKYS